MFSRPDRFIIILISCLLFAFAVFRYNRGHVLPCFSFHLFLHLRWFTFFYPDFFLTHMMTLALFFFFLEQGSDDMIGIELGRAS